MNSIFEVNTKLGMIEYLAMVDIIVSEYFQDGNYQPHYGNLNAMRLFYNNCVMKSKFDEQFGHDISDASDMIEIVNDSEFIDAYNSAILDNSRYDFNFGSAYRDAMEIVNVKKTSFGNAVDIVGSMLEKLAAKLTDVLNEENIRRVNQIAQDVVDGKLNADAIVDAYATNLERLGNSNNVVSFPSK